MEFIIERFLKTEEYTVGRLSILTRDFDEYLGREDKEFICDTLEPPFKLLGMNPHVRHKHKAALTAGRYPLVVRYSEQYKTCLPLIVGMPKLMNKDVRMVKGNSVDDIHVGLIPGAYRGDGKMVDSSNMIYTIKQLIVKVKERGEGVFIQIRN